MTITYPLLIVQDDSGTLVSGATIAITSVTDKAGSAIASPGATINQAGPNVSVDYDAEPKGECWITLAISKVGSTFTGANAAPSFYLARDSGRTLFALPAVAPGAGGGLAIASQVPANFTSALFASAGVFAQAALANAPAGGGGGGGDPLATVVPGTYAAGTAGAILGAIGNQAIASAVVSNTTPTVTAFTGGSGLSAVDNFYQGMIVVFVSGALQGVPLRVNAYTGATKLFAFDALTPWPIAPAVTDKFNILGRID